MTLKSKLLFYFFCITILFVIVGTFFYVQLSSLILPLNPQSIPSNVENLAKIHEICELKNNLLFKKLQLNYDLEKLASTNKYSSLQRYYKNLYLFNEDLEKAQKINPLRWRSLEAKAKMMMSTNQQIIHLLSLGDIQTARSRLESIPTIQASKEVSRGLEEYFSQSSIDKSEAMVVNVKLTAKNSYAILKKSLDITLIIFLDAILASVLLIFGSAHTLIHPINELRNNIEKMGVDKGNLKINPEILLLPDEVGDLARAFAHLFQHLQEATVLRDELIAEITRHKRTEKQLRKTALRLKESNQELDQFSYAASHDLRSPLRAIESLVSWIEEDCYDILPAESRKNFDLIRRRVQRLDDLISGMLEYSHAGRTTQDQEKVDLNILLKEIIDNLSPPAHIEIRIENELPTLLAYKAKITQVFLNLINNAIKYNDKPKGFISIGCTLKDRFYEFYVADNGRGIAKEFYQKIFEIFQTLHSRDLIEGSGIGLAIVKKIITKHGGQIWLESAVDVGTTFYFTWPQEKAPKAV
jgi:signal transduction histidine kinase